MNCIVPFDTIFRDCLTQKTVIFSYKHYAFLINLLLFLLELARNVQMDGEKKNHNQAK